MAMPVLPDDGSMIVWPGCRVPSASAASIIAFAMRSLTLPAGFWLSSLAQSFTRGFGLSTLTSTSGVSPMSSEIEPYRATASGHPARDRGEDRDLVAVGQLRVELVEVPHVLVVDVDVDELVELAVVAQHVAPQPGVADAHRLEHLADRGAVDGDGRLAAGVGAQHRGDADVDGHGGLLVVRGVVP